jgi:amino-acid N-acetyltransferase
MARIINGYAAQGLMLPKSHHQLYQYIRDYVVAVHDEEIIGCGALHIIWEDLAEIRSLAVVQEWQHKDVGRLMVEYLLQEARALGLPRVFALTYHQSFFEHMGFRVVPRESLPHKIWGDCLNCPKFPNCDEIALILDLKHEEEGA